jgi:hypothetical protein
MPYLEPEVARSRLVRQGIYTEENVPSVETIADVLERLEIRVDEWFDYSIAPTEYTERLTSNGRGLVLVHNYPVISILKVTQISPRSAPNALVFVNPQTLWDGKRTLFVGDLGGINYDVTYIAGYDPIPKLLVDSIFGLLTQVFQSGGLDFLDRPVRDLTNVSLPGGLAQTYRVAEPKSGADGGGATELDRALASLAKFKRKIRT